MDTDKRLIAFLLDPRSYAHPNAAVRHIETHISHVFVGDEFVYKVKKPVEMGFLDFTSLKRRRFFCEREIALNSRLSPQVYLSVTGIFRKGEQFSFEPFPGGRAVEYAVRMRRIPMDCLLHHLIERGEPLAGRLQSVGRALSLFHRNAVPYKGKRYGGVEAVRAKTEENFNQLEPWLGTAVDGKAWQNIVRYTREFIDRDRHPLLARRKAGHIRDGHGDLHCQHVCLGTPPVVFDCIEFNEAFRIIDVLEDIAFLLMDLEYRGRFDLSAELLQSYFTDFPEAFDPGLLGFYKVYRAVVRAKVESFLAGELDEGGSKNEALGRARNYLLLADHYTRNREKTFNPVVFMGLSGSGKSTIAERFPADAVLLRSDAIRKEMAGRAQTEHDYTSYGEGLYTAQMNDKVYAALADRAIEAVRTGRKVIVDATFLEKHRCEDFYRRSIREGAEPFFVQFVAGEEVLRERVKKRMQGNADISDATLDILEHQLRRREEPLGLPSFRLMRINTEGAINDVIFSLMKIM